jgi:AraC-like DNA-binding protein
MIGNDPAGLGAKPLALQSDLLGNPAVKAPDARYRGAHGSSGQISGGPRWLLSRQDDPRLTHTAIFVGNRAKVGRMTTNESGSAEARLPDHSSGLIRAALGGPGASLVEAFASLERDPGAATLSRHPSRELAGARLALPLDEGEGYFDLTRIGKDVYVIVGNFAYRNPRFELIPGEGMIQFYFKLSGDLTLGVSRTEAMRLNRPSLLVYSQPKGIDLQEWTAPRALERCVAVTLKARYLIENFLTARVAAPPPLQALAIGEPDQFKYVQLPLTAGMFELATKLVENPYSDTLRLIYTEAVTLELLCAAVRGFTEFAHAPNEEYSERDLRCLNRARDLLMTQLSPVPTIRQVARASGMNETLLKHGFKAVFGETLFDFSVRCRMQHALSLLRERRMPVARVADAVGYAHQTTFATAFRRHFGVRPREVRPLRPR